MRNNILNPIPVVTGSTNEAWRQARTLTLVCGCGHRQPNTITHHEYPGQSDVPKRERKFCLIGLA